MFEKKNNDDSIRFGSGRLVLCPARKKIGPVELNFKVGNRAGIFGGSFEGRPPGRGDSRETENETRIRWEKKTVAKRSGGVLKISSSRWKSQNDDVRPPGGNNNAFSAGFLRWSVDARVYLASMIGKAFTFCCKLLDRFGSTKRGPRSLRFGRKKSKKSCRIDGGNRHSFI